LTRLGVARGLILKVWLGGDVEGVSTGKRRR
jgi:hypothetical protein